ncbi:hypothetical protein PO538_08500, partial [Escherichia coli]
MVDVTDNQEALDIRQCFIFLSYENQCCHTSPFPVTSKEGANKQVISSQADSLIKISRIWAD